MALLGIDIGGTSIKTGLVDDAGVITQKASVDIDVLRKGNFIDNLILWLRPIINKANLTSAGIGVPGFVSKSEDYLIEIPNLAEIEGYDFINALKHSFPGVKFHFSNDANAAAYGAYKFCHNIKVDSFGYITLGTGMGSAIIDNGKIYTGANGNGPELGMIHIFGEKTAEQIVSKDGLLDLAKQQLLADSTLMSTLSIENLHTVHLYNAALENDPIALKVFDLFGADFGKAIAIFVQLFDIPTIYVGGGISPCLPFMKKSIHTVLEARLTGYHLKPFSIEEASLGNDAGIIGAAALCL
jgi:glucokinase